MEDYQFVAWMAAWLWMREKQMDRYDAVRLAVEWLRLAKDELVKEVS